MHALARTGIRAFKVAGRQASPYRRFRGVLMVRSMIDAIERGDPGPAVAAAARSVRSTPDLCASGLMCLFPEVTARDSPGPGT